MSWLSLLVGLLLAAGLIGSVVPFVPGTPLILGGAVLYAVATDFDPVGPWHLLVLVGLTGLAYSLDYLAGAAGARRFGGSRWAIVGSLLGALVGVFFGPVGLITGPVLGAVAAELAASRHIRTSLRSGLGTIAGMVVGTVAKFILALIMVCLFLWWTIGAPIDG